MATDKPPNDPPPYPGNDAPVTQQPNANGNGPILVAPAPTTVIVQQNVVTQPNPEREWSSGLFGCFEDFPSCLMGTFCPFYHLYILAIRMDEGCCLPFCCPAQSTLVPLRVKLRTHYRIKGSIIGDYFTTCCCYQCALCQLERELKHVKPAW